MRLVPSSAVLNGNTRVSDRSIEPSTRAPEHWTEAVEARSRRLGDHFAVSWDAWRSKIMQKDETVIILMNNKQISVKKLILVRLVSSKGLCRKL